MSKAGKSWCALLLAAIAGYWLLCLREFAEERLATADASSRTRAASLEPWDAENPYWLGRSALLDQQDLPTAISYFQQATRLNPRVPRYWLDLAVGYKAEGRASEAQAAMEDARKASPRDLDTLGEIASLYLAQGDAQRALAQYRVIIASDINAVDRSIDLAWRGTHDASLVVDDALPPETRYYGEFLHYLTDAQEYEAADRVWARLVKLGQAYPASEAMRYLDSLLAQKKVEQARAAWRDMAEMDPSLKRYISEPNLITNPGFQQEILNDGLDWRYSQGNSGVEFAFDAAQAHTGNQSLALTVDATVIPEDVLYQLVPVDPGRRYRFGAWARTEELLSAVGPEIVVEDAYTHASLFTGPELSGTTDWRQIAGEFTTGPETRLVRVRLGRAENDKRIRGKLWLDDFELVPQPVEATR